MRLNWLILSHLPQFSAGVDMQEMKLFLGTVIIVSIKFLLHFYWGSIVKICKMTKTAATRQLPFMEILTHPIVVISIQLCISPSLSSCRVLLFIASVILVSEICLEKMYSIIWKSVSKLNSKFCLFMLM